MCHRFLTARKAYPAAAASGTPPAPLRSSCSRRALENCHQALRHLKHPITAVAPGHSLCTCEVCAGHAEEQSEHSVNAPGTETPFGCRQGTKTGQRAETETLAGQRNQKRRQQRSRAPPNSPATVTLRYCRGTSRITAPQASTPADNTERESQQAPRSPTVSEIRAKVGRPRPSQPARRQRTER